MNTNYRNSNQIILRILECILKNKSSGEKILKTHIMQYANLKTTIAEKYLNSLENAGYIERLEDIGEKEL
jgi:predicted transcriptional regulator